MTRSTRVVVFLVLLLAVPVGIARAGSMMTELANALKLGEGDGTSDDLISFTLHFGTETEPVVVTGRDFQSFKVFEQDGTPIKVELYAGQGTEKHNILINIASAKYYRLNVAKRANEWHYDFHFYY